MGKCAEMSHTHLYWMQWLEFLVPVLLSLHWMGLLQREILQGLQCSFHLKTPNRGLVFSGFDFWPLDLVLIFHVGLHNHVLQAFQEAKVKNM